jgi:hypothetical protein
MRRLIIAAAASLLALAAWGAEGEAMIAREPVGLPNLGARTDGAETIPLARPSTLRERHFQPRQPLGPRPYWERDPLFTPMPLP